MGEQKVCTRTQRCSRYEVIEVPPEPRYLRRDERRKLPDREKTTCVSQVDIHDDREEC
jgi:hypothetical protein